MSKELITYSRKASFNACRRRHMYSYTLGVRPIRQAIQLVFGDTAHRWLEAWLSVQQISEDPVWLCPVAPIGVNDYERDEVELATMAPVEAAFRSLEKLDPYEAAKLRAMVLAYHVRWRESMKSIAVHEVERQFRTDTVDPRDGAVSDVAENGGKIDAIVCIDGQLDDQTQNGFWGMEHKTAKGDITPGSTYHKKTRIDSQISDYMVGAKSLGYDLRGMIYDVLGKPPMEPHRATPPEARKYTQGNGCKVCGGKKGFRGRGCFYTAHKDPCGWCNCCMKNIECDDLAPCDCCKAMRTAKPCAACKSTGWKIDDDGNPEAPRLYANQRERDETPGEYGLRCFVEIATSPEKYLQRYFVVRHEEEIYENQLENWITAHNIIETQNAGVAPRNKDQCFLYGRPCDYTPVCFDGADINDSRLYQITGKHPELVHTVRETTEG